MALLHKKTLISLRINLGQIKKKFVSGNGSENLGRVGTHILTVIRLQFWAYGSWDSPFPISMSPTANL